MDQIFISYRRDDTGSQADRLASILGKRLGQKIFFDLNDIPYSNAFKKTVATEIALSDVVLVLIGKRWVGERDGKRRIDNPDDTVRFEVETALEQGKKVLPILFDDQPELPALPSTLSALNELNRVSVRSETFDDDAKRLIRWFKTYTGSAASLREVGWPFSWAAPIVAQVGMRTFRVAACLTVVISLSLAGAGVNWYVANLARDEEAKLINATKSRRDEEDSRLDERRRLVGNVLVGGEGEPEILIEVKRNDDGALLASGKSVDGGKFSIKVPSDKAGLDEWVQLWVKHPQFKPFSESFKLINGPAHEIRLTQLGENNR